MLIKYFISNQIIQIFKIKKEREEKRNQKEKKETNNAIHVLTTRSTIVGLKYTCKIYITLNRLMVTYLKK